MQVKSLPRGVGDGATRLVELLSRSRCSTFSPHPTSSSHLWLQEAVSMQHQPHPAKHTRHTLTMKIAKSVFRHNTLAFIRVLTRAQVNAQGTDTEKRRVHVLCVFGTQVAERLCSAGLTVSPDWSSGLPGVPKVRSSRTWISQLPAWKILSHSYFRRFFLCAFVCFFFFLLFWGLVFISSLSLSLSPLPFLLSLFPPSPSASLPLFIPF